MKPLTLLFCACLLVPCLAQEEYEPLPLPAPAIQKKAFAQKTLYRGVGGALQSLELIATKQAEWDLVTGALAWAGAPPAAPDWDTHMLLIASSANSSIEISNVRVDFPGGQLLNPNPGAPPSLNAQLVVTVLHAPLSDASSTTPETIQPTLHVVRVPRTELPVHFEHLPRPTLEEIEFSYETEFPAGKAKVRIFVDKAGRGAVDYVMDQTTYRWRHPLSPESLLSLYSAYSAASGSRIPKELPGSAGQTPFEIRVKGLSPGAGSLGVRGFLSGLEQLEAPPREGLQGLLQALGRVEDEVMTHGKATESAAPQAGSTTSSSEAASATGGVVDALNEAPAEGSSEK